MVQQGQGKSDRSFITLRMIAQEFRAIQSIPIAIALVKGFHFDLSVKAKYKPPPFVLMKRSSRA